MDAIMNSSRIIPAVAVPEGAGVIVHRTIGTPVLRDYDPFLLLDHISSNNPDDYIAGFPSHPHRGFTTFTYIIDGHMMHQDDMGNSGDLRPGSAQWMKAASGIIHSEMPQQENGLLRGFQLWINLPAANKMDPPEYQAYSAEAFPVLDTPDYTLKVLMRMHLSWITLRM
ncbi:MAG: pirin family protein [Nitrosomonas ureae]